MMVANAIENADEVTRDGVRDALASIKDLEIPSGKMTMAEDRNPIKGGVVMEYDETGVSHFVEAVDAS